MKALIFEERGDPASVINLVEMEAPVPLPGQALVKIIMSPVHPSDVNMLRGTGGNPPDLPASPGQEAVGIVVAMGTGVERLKAGDRVIFVNVWGTWRELVTCEANRLLPVPDDITDEVAAQILINPLTAYLMTMAEFQIIPGEWLLQTAAASAVGKLVLQLSAIIGFKTINVVYKRDHVELVNQLGANEVICTEDNDLHTEIMRITENKGISMATDCVGGQTAAVIARSLAPGGRLLVFGALSSHGQTGASAYAVPVFAPHLIYSGSSIQGFWIFQWLKENSLPVIEGAINELWRYFRDGSLTLLPVKRFQPEEMLEALAWVRNGDGRKPVFVFDRRS